MNQHNSLRLEIIQLLQERSQLVSALSSHLPRCTSSCADSTAAALSRCSRTPPPEVPRPLSPLTPLTSPDSERRPSGGSSCSWGSVGDMALESCALPFGGGGFPCGGSVMANPAMTPSPTASVSPGYCGRPASGAGYGLYSPPGAGVPGNPQAAAMMLSSPSCSAMVAPHGGQGALMSPPGQPQQVKMNLNSPTGGSCALYGGPQGGYMAPPGSQQDGYGYYNCGQTAPAPTQTPYPAGYGGQGAGYGQNYSGYGRMC